MRNSALLAVIVALCGCTAMSENECRSADWYQVGYRDADPYGLQPQIGIYANQCKAWVQASESEYMRGWVDGYREWNTKMTGSECCR